MTPQERESQYIKETGDKKPNIIFGLANLDWYKRYSTWLSEQLEKGLKLAFMNGWAYRHDEGLCAGNQSEDWFKWKKKFNQENAPKIGRVTILLESSDQGYPPDSKGHKLCLNAMGLWYKVDNGEWRRCKRHSRFGILQDIVQAIDSEANK